jgi:hypothetical protein
LRVDDGITVGLLLRNGWQANYRLSVYQRLGGRSASMAGVSNVMTVEDVLGSFARGIFGTIALGTL